MAYVRDNMHPLELQHQALRAELRQVVEERRLLRAGLVMHDVARLNAKERTLNERINRLLSEHPVLLK